MSSSNPNEFTNRHSHPHSHGQPSTSTSTSTSAPGFPITSSVPHVVPPIIPIPGSQEAFDQLALELFLDSFRYQHQHQHGSVSGPEPTSSSSFGGGSLPVLVPHHSLDITTSGGDGGGVVGPSATSSTLANPLTMEFPSTTTTTNNTEGAVGPPVVRRLGPAKRGKVKVACDQ